MHPLHPFQSRDRITKRNRRLLSTALFLCALLLLSVFALTVQGQGNVLHLPFVAHQGVLPKYLTILHTNDFHGYLQTDSRGRGGSAYMASKLKEIRTEIGEANVALLDAGDVYLGAAPISQLLLGESAIDIYNMLGYDVAAYVNYFHP